MQTKRPILKNILLERLNSEFVPVGSNKSHDAVQNRVPFLKLRRFT